MSSTVARTPCVHQYRFKYRSVAMVEGRSKGADYFYCTFCLEQRAVMDAVEMPVYVPPTEADLSHEKRGFFWR